MKKFAVSTNLYFSTFSVVMNEFGLMLQRITISCFVVTALTIVNPMNPIFTTTLKDNSDGNSYYSKNNLLKQLAIYSAVGVVGTLIALVIMMLPYPILYVR